MSDAIYLPGIALFFLGTYINFEHHIRLRNLRKPGEKKYVAPVARATAGTSVTSSVLLFSHADTSFPGVGSSST